MQLSIYDFIKGCFQGGHWYILLCECDLDCCKMSSEVKLHAMNYKVFFKLVLSI